MIKRVAAGAIVFVILGSSNISAYANPINTSNIPKITNTITSTRDTNKKVEKINNENVKEEKTKNEKIKDEKVKEEKIKDEKEIKEEQSFEVVNPKKEMVISDKSMVLSFKAPQGTNVSIEVYHNISKDKEEEDYVLSYDPIEITVGSLKMGWAEIDLNSGLNKIHFTAKYKNGSEDTAVRIVNVMDTEEVKQLLEEIVSKSTLGISKRP